MAGHSKIFGWRENKSAVEVVPMGRLLDLVYPVGSIYMSVSEVNPSDLFGGTWEAWGSGRVPVGVNSADSEFNEAEKTGGEKTHKLTESEMPQHSHSFSATSGKAGSHNHTVQLTTGSGGGHSHSIGGGNCPSLYYQDGIVQANTQAYWSGGAYTISRGDSYKYGTNTVSDHNHSVSGNTWSNGEHTHSVSGTTGNKGSSGAHNNLQPYIAGYMWKRTA